MGPLDMTLRDRLYEVRARVAEAAVRSGRSAENVTLIAVSKNQPVEACFDANDLGQEHFGESTAQELMRKVDAFAQAGRKARWHFIGRLQRNKVNHVLKTGATIHSIDSLELAEAVSQRAPEAGVQVLVQVNIGDESQKGGVALGEAEALVRAVRKLPRLTLLGLMGVPPVDVDAAPYFSRLSDLGRALQVRELSMGMSHDFEAAISAGATMVRVGTSIFGERRYA